MVVNRYLSFISLIILSNFTKPFSYDTYSQCTVHILRIIVHRLRLIYY